MYNSDMLINITLKAAKNLLQDATNLKTDFEKCEILKKLQQMYAYLM